MTSILHFQHGQHVRIVDLLEGRLDPTTRWTGRISGSTGGRSRRWPSNGQHAQNDALGYLLWLSSQLIRDGWLKPGAAQILILGELVHVLRRHRYWEDEDSGHWEEARKIEASSIGAASRGCVSCGVWSPRPSRRGLCPPHAPVTPELLDTLIESGLNALNAILPHECTQPGKERQADSALLFLIYPLDVVQGETADAILRTVRTHLQGEHGIRRYLGDSYWCAGLPHASLRGDADDQLQRRHVRPRLAPEAGARRSPVVPV